MQIRRSEDGSEIAVRSRDEIVELVNKNNTELKIRKVILKLNEKDKDTIDDLKKEITKFINSDEFNLEVSTTQENLSTLRNIFFGETEQESQVKLLKENENRAYYLLNEKPLDLHRPYIDKVYFEKDGKKYNRIAE